MKSATEPLRSALLFLALFGLSACDSSEGGAPAAADALSSDTLRHQVLRSAALRYGLVRPSELEIAGQPTRQAVGEKLFASELLSLNGEISCQSCHLDRFGSADGLPNGIGVGGVGEGHERLRSGGLIVPRNVLPLWGRGSRGFDTLFWDGKVQLTETGIVSQFGDRPPSSDPLTLAAHLPFVELREMILDTDEIRQTLATEEVDAAERVFEELARRVRNDVELGPAVAGAFRIRVSEIHFRHVAVAIAEFIRHRFRVQPTKLHRFVFDDGPIRQAELRGGIIFYGKGRCSSCHAGPYFTDFDFHAVPFPQAGFGKNGFGVDQGRYNVTFAPEDRYRFRTPPLYNVTRTAPYSHSGSVADLRRAIVYHFDPLRYMDPSQMTGPERLEEYRRLGVSAVEPLPASLSDQEVDDVIAFLGMLEF
ncbi:His-Xaa-Ser system-associated MauG-like protein [Sphingosinicella sp. CPCC 101087]|uniref:His-Xaa-Ser system-associated MauG-like protein n=1 Tax=Sphingosinicella sp. CPCC 101087 TaxID=2497754 RepID=UPI00101D630E|nr:His-Xaa-Ser system-associated MauG-like protein [Sphingosinicella sp. CPCC 101087]